MRRSLLSILTVSAVLILALKTEAADDPALRPKIDEQLPGAFHPFNVTGKSKGKFHCLVCEYGLSPVAIVFVREAGLDEQLADLLARLDKAVGKYDKANFRSFAVRLSDGVLDDEQRADPATTRQQIFTDNDKRADLAKDFPSKVDPDLKLQSVILTLSGPVGPNKYNLNKDAAVTVILYHNHKVKATFAYKDKLTKEDVDAILAKVVEMAAPKP